VAVVAIVTDVNGPVVLVNVKAVGLLKGTGAPTTLGGTAKLRPFDGSLPPVPVPTPVTIAIPTSVMGADEPLTVKLTSVNVESGSAVSVLVPTVKSLGIGSEALAPVVSVAA
jgi:hypothetical protein